MKNDVRSSDRPRDLWINKPWSESVSPQELQMRIKDAYCLSSGKSDRKYHWTSGAVYTLSYFMMGAFKDDMTE